MKTSMTAHDIQCMVNQLKNMNIEGSWIDKIYDSEKGIIIKFSINKENTNFTNKKIYLLLKSGQYFYLLDDFKSDKTFPSGFSMKLRKEIGNFRLEKMEQLSYDRVLELTFGKKEMKYKLILEMYGGGNIIFLDDNDKIIATYRIFHYDEENKIRVGYIYPREKAIMDNTQFNPDSNILLNELNEKKNKIDKVSKLRNLLNNTSISNYPPILIKHILNKYYINYNKNIYKTTNLNELFDNKLNNIIQDFENYRLNKIDLGLSYTNSIGFYPTLYSFLDVEKDKLIHHNNILDAIKYYFNTKEKLDDNNENKIIKNKKKPKIQNLIENLEGKHKNKIEEINNIEYFNMLLLENIINTIKYYINNEVKDIIFYKNLKFDENITISNLEYHNKIVILNINGIDIKFNLNKSIHSNLNDFYKEKKLIDYKINRTKEASNNLQKEQNKNNKKDKLIEFPHWNRKENWFEKFRWFMTSNNKIFVLGRNADQNEELYSKYLTKNDLYFHSNVSGSGSGILKNGFESSPIELEECGIFLISHTNSWKEQVADKPYWVYSYQVSKTPESGEYITKGSFIIRGKKNYLSAPKLQLGITFIVNHGNNEFDYNIDKNIQYAIPMLAPYSCISSNENKMKIIPGTKKAGKTIKNNIIPYFSKNIFLKSIIKKLSNDEFNKIMISNVKII